MADNPYINENPSGPLLAGEAITAGDAICIAAADEKAYLADANVGTRRPCVGFAETTVAITKMVEVKGHGRMGSATGLTAGATLYLSETPGAITHTPPASYVQGVGIAKTDTEFDIHLDPGGYAY